MTRTPDDSANEDRPIGGKLADRQDERARLRAIVDDLKIEQQHLRDANALKERQIAEYAADIARLNASPWRRCQTWLTRRLNDIRDRINPHAAEKNADGTDYARWIKLYDTLSGGDRGAIKAHIERLSYQPLISIIMAAREMQEPLLRDTIDAVRAQLYSHWQLCIADDGSCGPASVALMHEMTATEPRIKWIRNETDDASTAHNSALALATGEFVALLNQGDRLAEQALYEIVAELNTHPDADLIYSDEDRIDADGTRHAPHFMTDWNRELFLAANEVPHLCVVRKALVDKIGGYRRGYSAAQDYDLILRVADASEPRTIRHIPAVLCHRHAASSAISDTQIQAYLRATRSAKADYFLRRGEAAKPVENPFCPKWDWIRRPVPAPAPLVSLIVPTRNRHDLLGPCLEGLLNETNYCPLEIIIIDHESDEPETIALLDRWRGDPRARIMRYEGPFNYSDMNNKAVAVARGEFVGLVNNDISVIHADWLAEMVSLAVLPGSGAVGAKLLYPDETVQHGGVVLGILGVANHAHYKAQRHALGYFGKLVLASDISAVTGACLVVRRAVYEEVGGLDADNLPVSFNDVDLCLKIQARGYRNIWTPFACLYHHESPSRGSDMAPDKVERARREALFMRSKWAPHLDDEPFYNANLTLKGCDFALAFPPRRVKPWRTPNERVRAANAGEAKGPQDNS
jgi:GT2 family glycosyltransferase